MSQKVICVIPARGGSKGIPRKNIKPLLGKPLIAWTIEAAQKSKLLDRIFVSTEDAEIKEVALKHGVEVIDRPQEFATDEASTWCVLKHALDVLAPDYVPDAVVALQATVPYRGDGLIDKCIEKFIKGNYDSVITGYLLQDEPYGEHPGRRQDIKGELYADGSVYVIKRDIILGGDVAGEKFSYVQTKSEEQVDIDDEYDFWLAGKVLKERR